MRVLVTGDRGFIGRKLLKEMASWPRVEAQGMDLVEGGSVTDLQDCRRRCEDVDVVVHLAAKGGVVASLDDPQDSFHTNVGGTLNMLRAAEEMGVKQFILASTGGALMGNQDPPVDESFVPMPISPYGASKAAAEAYCHAFMGSSNMHIKMLRFGNVYGPGSKKGLIYNLLKAVRDEKPLQVYGDGVQVRDFVFVDDICWGILDAMQEGKAGAYHLGGYPMTVREVVGEVRSVTGTMHHPVEYLGRRKGEVHRTWASYAKAAKELGYGPVYRFREGLQFTWDWVRDGGDL